MINVKDLRDKTVFFLKEGKHYATVMDIVIDGQNFSTQYVAVRCGPWYRPVKLIPFEKIIAISGDLVTVRSEDDMLDINKSMAALLDENTELSQSKIIDETGNYRGNIKTFNIDERNGKVVSISLSGGQDITIDGIMTMSPGIIVVRRSALEP